MLRSARRARLEARTDVDAAFSGSAFCAGLSPGEGIIVRCELTGKDQGLVGDQQQVVRFARPKRSADGDIGCPIGLGHSVIEENAEHPIAAAAQPVVGRQAVALGCLIAALITILDTLF